MEPYSDDLLDHASKPHNRALLEPADGHGAMRNPVCGDLLEVTVRIEDGMIQAMGWDGKGCVPSIGVASMLSEMVVGRPVDEVMALTEAQLIEAVGGLPTTKLHSAALGVGALRAALREYQNAL